MKPLTLFFFLLPFFLFSQTTAFEGALGPGAYATGGRNQNLKFVTNLNATGEGSFRQAVSSAGIVIFKVAGVVASGGTIDVASNVTILGHSAPGRIILTDRLRMSGKSDIIIRHITVAPRYAGNDVIDLINSSNIIIDHVSSRWGGDENASARLSQNNITFQRLLIAESKTGSLMGDSNNGYNSNLGLYYSVYYNTSHRFPNANTNARFDVIGNVIHNPKNRLIRTGFNVQLNHIANYVSWNTRSSLSPYYGNLLDYRNGRTPSVYSALNRMNNGILTSNSEDNYSRIWQKWDPDPSQRGGAAVPSYKRSTMHPLLGPNFVLPADADEARSNVLADVGANKYIDNQGNVVKENDAIDNIYLNNISNNNFVGYSEATYTNTAHYTNFHGQTFPIQTASRPIDWDTDGDGIWDTYELQNGLNVGTNESMIIASNGRTNIENFYNQVDGSATTAPPTPTYNFIVERNGNQTTEQGGSIDFTIRLSSEPNVNVVVTTTSSDLSEGEFSTASLSFDSTNWNLGLTTTLTGQNDGIEDGNVVYYAIFEVDDFTTSDSNFENSTVQTFSISNIDDDLPSPSAPVLESVVLSGSDYILTFSQPTGTLDPAGGYDTYINGVDQNDNANYAGFTRTITGLDTTKAQHFVLESRYTQLEPRQFPRSNEIIVPAVGAMSENIVVRKLHVLINQ